MTTHVQAWVRDLTEDVIGGPPLEVGGKYVHPTDGPIEVTSGQYWGRNGLSNFWHWKVLETGEERHGYGEPWPPL